MKLIIVGCVFLFFLLGASDASPGSLRKRETAEAVPHARRLEAPKVTCRLDHLEEVGVNVCIIESGNGVEEIYGFDVNCPSVNNLVQNDVGLILITDAEVNNDDEVIECDVEGRGSLVYVVVSEGVEDDGGNDRQDTESALPSVTPSIVPSLVPSLVPSGQPSPYPTVSRTRMNEIIPCIAVIDETEGFAGSVLDAGWSSFRAQYPERPFCLLHPTGVGSLHVPAAFTADDNTIFAEVTCDDFPSISSDWFSLCGLADLKAAGITDAAISIGNTGSFSLSDVQNSFDLFVTRVAENGLNLINDSMTSKNYVAPFMKDF